MAIIMIFIFLAIYIAGFIITDRLMSKTAYEDLKDCRDLHRECPIKYQSMLLVGLAIMWPIFWIIMLCTSCYAICSHWYKTYRERINVKSK